MLVVRIIAHDKRGVQILDEVEHEDYTLVRISTHPNFDPVRLSNNIAILGLDRPLDLASTEGLNAACLPACNNMFDYKFQNGTGVRCWVAGWGASEDKGKGSNVLKKVDLPLVDRKICEQKYSRILDVTLEPGEICAGGESGKFTCNGDGGSPLICESKTGNWHAVGLVSWGKDCENDEFPGVFVNIYHYIDWITESNSNKKSKPSSASTESSDLDDPRG